nr:hypothetical protein [Mesorhizobium sp. B2-8-9]
MSFAIGEAAGGDQHRHQEGGEAGAHNRHEGDLEAAVIGPAADGDAAQQRNEDHPRAAMPRQAEGGHMAKLVQGDHRDEDRRQRQAAKIEPEERPQDQGRKRGEADLAQRMLEPAAPAISARRRPDVELAQFATHGEETEDQERDTAIAVGLGERHSHGLAFRHKLGGLAIVRPERGIERRVLDDGHREVASLPHILEPRLAVDRPAVPSFPGEPDQRRPFAIQGFGGKDFARPAGVAAERPQRLPKAIAVGLDHAADRHRAQSERHGHQKKDQSEIAGHERDRDDDRHLPWLPVLKEQPSGSAAKKDLTTGGHLPVPYRRRNRLITWRRSRSPWKRERCSCKPVKRRPEQDRS